MSNKPVVERFKFRAGSDVGTAWVESVVDDEGGYVSYEDYAVLEQQRDEMAMDRVQLTTSLTFASLRAEKVEQQLAAGSIFWTAAGRDLNLEHGTPLFLGSQPPAGLISFVEFLEKELPDEAYEYGDENIRNAWIWLKDVAEKSKRKNEEK